MRLSIVIPVYNESLYIEECVSSLLSNVCNDFEIVLSDNCSSDNTVQLVEKYADPRVNLVRPHAHKVSPFENYWAAIWAAKGEYVFIMGGDDYLESRVIDKIIPKLENNIAVIGRMACFSDDTREVFEVANGRHFLESLFGSSGCFYDAYFSNLRDEVMYAFIKREIILPTYRLIDNSLERFLVWQALSIFPGIDGSDVDIYDGTVVYKRYNKSELSGDYTRDAHSSFVKSLYMVKATSSLFNALYVFVNQRDVRCFLRILFSIRRFKVPGGFIGLNKEKQLYYFGPVVMFLMSPLIDFARLLRFISHEFL